MARLQFVLYQYLWLVVFATAALGLGRGALKSLLRADSTSRLLGVPLGIALDR